MKLTELREKFRGLFGRPAAVAVRAPGRVNLIGEHTDYNDGFVLPIAIQRQTIALAAPRADMLVNLVSVQGDAPAFVNLDQPIHPGEPGWANYPRGVAAGLLEHGIGLLGADILFDSDIPLGGGLSSSASLEVATAMALLHVANAAGRLSQKELALLCQQAEHRFANSPCGIMDQFIAIMGRKGRALLLDCRNGQTRQIPFDDPSIVLLVADTHVKHAISDGGYAARRQQCHAAAAALGVPALRDADKETVASAQRSGKLVGKELMRARHVVSEIARTLAATQALEQGDYRQFGKLMYASHESLRDDHEVSCPELDAIVSRARSCPGVYGARMTGGGFGGCAIVLVDAAAAEAVWQSIAADFAARFGHACPIFATAADEGAGIIRD